jgi:hypothetical protein
MERLVQHNAALGFVEEGLSCVMDADDAGRCTASADALVVRNIGEGLAYAGGEELKWHHDGNQIHSWLEQRDVLSSLIVHHGRNRHGRWSNFVCASLLA